MQFMLPEHVLILAALVLVLVLLGLTAGDDGACQSVQQRADLLSLNRHGVSSRIL